MSRLLKDPSAPRRMAFTAFDHLRADLVIRIVDVKGASKLSSEESAGAVYRIDDYEGPASEPSSLFVDKDGKIVFARAGKVTMRRSDRGEMERVLGTRVSEADARIGELEKQRGQTDDRFRKPQ